MNAVDVLHYGHQTVLKTIDGLPQSEWETGGVCGMWSVKEIIAHLASYERILIDVLNTFLEGGPTPYLSKWGELGGQAFNDSEVAARQRESMTEVLAEYTNTQTQTMELAARIAQERFPQPGTLPWYGLEYALDDFIVYTFYGHKREHCAQISIFRDHLNSKQ